MPVTGGADRDAKTLSCPAAFCATGHRTPLVGALDDTRTIFLGEAGQDAAAARSGEVKPRPVQSEATVNLITSAVGAISRDKKLGRAEALAPRHAGGDRQG
jgi:hypothetical protein